MLVLPDPRILSFFSISADMCAPGAAQQGSYDLSSIIKKQPAHCGLRTQNPGRPVESCCTGQQEKGDRPVVANRQSGLGKRPTLAADDGLPFS